MWQGNAEKVMEAPDMGFNMFPKDSRVDVLLLKLSLCPLVRIQLRRQSLGQREKEQLLPLCQAKEATAG